MFEKFKIRTAIIEICRIGQLDHGAVLDFIPSSVMNTGIQLMKKHKASAKDAAAYVVTFSHSNTMANCEKLLDKHGVKLIAESINLLTAAAKTAIEMHEARNGDSRCIVLPQDLIPENEFKKMEKFAHEILGNH